MGRNIYDINGVAIPIVGGDPVAAKTKLAGKVLIAIGDSYTVGMGTALQALCNKYGMVLDLRGVTGSMIRVGGNNPMCTRVDTIVQNYTDGKTISGTTYYKDDVCAITFMGGTNDGPSNGVIGDGINETATTTIYGALHHIFYTLLKEFKKAKVICITQPSHYALSAASVVDREAAALALGFDNMAQAQALDDVQFSSYCCNRTQDAVRETSQMYGTELIDMIRDMPPISNPSNKSAYWAGDKIHLSSAGYQLIINAIEKKLLDLYG